MSYEKPSIVFILSDDQGAWAMGCSGNREIITPGMDRLAREGMRFESFFCVSPVCSPTRASLLTGQIPSQHGVYDWLRDDNKRQEDIEYLKGQLAYTDLLSEHGYMYGLSGKRHPGKSSVPQENFTHWFARKSDGGPYYGTPFYREDQLVTELGYVTDVITDDAISFIREYANRQPFYLQVGYAAPHAPWLNNHPKGHTDLYERCPFESCPMEEGHPDSIYLTGEVLKDLKSDQIGYYAAVTVMDKNIGRILEQIEELGIREETLVIFGSNNGFSCGYHGFWGKGNGTFPINMYESSVKVPFIASRLSVVPAGVVDDSLILAYGFMPTLPDYVEIGWKGQETLPDRSFLPALRGKALQQDEHVVVMDEYDPNWMIRRRRYKYIKRYPYGPNELCDLEKDPEEQRSLLLDREEDSALIRQQLDYELERWFLKYVNPGIDGAREAMYSSGQTQLAGTRSYEEPSHNYDDYIKEKLQKAEVGEWDKNILQ